MRARIKKENIGYRTLAFLSFDAHLYDWRETLIRYSSFLWRVQQSFEFYWCSLVPKCARIHQLLRCDLCQPGHIVVSLASIVAQVVDLLHLTTIAEQVLHGQSISNLRSGKLSLQFRAERSPPNW